MFQTATALGAAHDRGIVHRDIKPENLMLRPDGYIKVLDFGLAKLRADLESTPRRTGADTLTAAGAFLGTPAYMAPEQVQELPADARTDVFALGLLFHELLTGQHPFSRAATVDMLHAVVHYPPPPLGDDVSPEVRAILEKALQKSPDDRYQSGRELAHALQAVRDGSPRHSLRRSRLGRWQGRRVAAAATLALGGIVPLASLVA